jgi:DNA repair protein RecO (recombination protein O)
MLHTTQGIVLHSFKYSDTSVVVKILTRNLGLQSYLVQGVRKKGAKVKAGLFQHLNLVDLVVWHKDNQGLQRIKEIRCSHPLINIGTDIRKSTVAIFLSEMLLNAFQHQQEARGDVFDFLCKSILQLELADENISVFHHLFLLGLTQHLGFTPSAGYSEEKCCFNLREGIYERAADVSGICLSADESRYFYQLTRSAFYGESLPRIPSIIRQNLLWHLVDYYRLHLEGFRDVKSLDILEAVFRQN